MTVILKADNSLLFVSLFSALKDNSHTLRSMFLFLTNSQAGTTAMMGVIDLFCEKLANWSDSSRGKKETAFSHYQLQNQKIWHIKEV